jgi:hypothetical protein
MNEVMNKWSVQLAGMLALAAAFIGVLWAADGIAAAVPAAALLLGLIALLHFGRRRSGTLEVMSGVGDERTRTLYTQAVAFTGNVMIAVLLGWWLVTVALGDPNETLSALGAVAGVTFVLAIVVLARRG